MDDWNLLQQYVQQGSRQAFDEIFQRHVTLVYATALRDLGDPHLAQDVTQAVFVVLMRRAKNISPNVVLPGWLFKVTRYAAADARKGRLRREHHERQAAAMKTVEPSSEPNAAWEQLMPFLNDAIAALPRPYRDAVVMNYLQGKSHREIAMTQHITENSARQQLFRALARLRAHFQRKGLMFSQDVLGTTLATAAAQRAPAGLVPSPLFLAPNTQVTQIVAATLRRIYMNQLKIIASVSVIVLLLVFAGIGIDRFAVAGTSPIAPAQTPSLASTDATTAPPPATQPALDPRGVVPAAYNAGLAGDSQAFIGFFEKPLPAQRNLLREMALTMHAIQQLNQAMTIKFGRDESRWLFDNTIGGIITSDINSAPEVITGDTAYVDLGNRGPGKIKLDKVGSDWKISSRVLRGINTDMVHLTYQWIPAVNQITQDVTNGRYATADEVKQALQESMNQLFASMQQPPAARQ
ncbi:MAG TPA: sigma-70 family RNA polymerase sigma factor [Phycisphaerae bacterium]|nr:sigma-70 family RNA polymerase sigma factor [Phycisphaerae bacterium]